MYKIIQINKVVLITKRNGYVNICENRLFYQFMVNTKSWFQKPKLYIIGEIGIGKDVEGARWRSG
jgi:glutaredoxin-related protein